MPLCPALSARWSSFPFLVLVFWLSTFTTCQLLDMLVVFKITWPVRPWVEDDTNTISFR